MRIPFRLVDVFTDRPLAGNQLCVVPDPIDLPDDAMQAVAQEIGFSETTFVTEAEGDRYSMRIFTPGSEVPFAGHPSLGTAFVLVSEGRVTSPALQTVAAGEFRLEVDLVAGTAWMDQGSPVFGSVVDDRDSVARAVGLSTKDLHPEAVPQIVSTGLPHLLVATSEEGALARVRPDLDRLTTLLDGVGADACYVFFAEPGRARARMFFPAAGIGEDPATGSAAGPLGAYLAERGLLTGERLIITQGVELGRPSTLLVDVERADTAWRVAVGGGVLPVGRGQFDLPG